MLSDAMYLARGALERDGDLSFLKPTSPSSHGIVLSVSSALSAASGLDSSEIDQGERSRHGGWRMRQDREIGRDPNKISRIT